MIDLNIIYFNTEPEQGYALRRGNVRVLWTKRPAKGCVLHAYLGSYSYFPGTGVPQILIQGEPVTVHPREYTPEIFRYFDHILAFVKPLEGITPRFHRWNHPAYEKGPNPDELPIPTLERSRALYPLEGRKDAIIMILGNKSSHIPGELYSLRRKMALWFHEHSRFPFDVYGMPPFTDLPNYRGGVAHSAKLSLLAQYRFNVCFENSYDPFWTAGYMTERLLQSIETRTVPIYYGCSTIEEYVPKECFIDYRDFDGFEDLNDYLESMSEEEYHGYIERMEQYLAEADYSRFSIFKLYDRLAAFHAEWSGDDLDTLFDGETRWTPTEMPPERVLSRVDEAIVGQALPFWSWDYLKRSTLEEVEAGIERLRKEGDAALPPVVDVRKLPPIARKKGAVEIRRILYVGRLVPSPPFECEAHYAAGNFLTAFHCYPDLEVDYYDFVEMAPREGRGGMSQRLFDYVRETKPDLLFYVPLHASFDVTPEVLRDITEKTDTRTVAWIVHDPALFEFGARLVAPCVDLVVTTSEKDRIALVRSGFGANVIKTRWAFDPWTYRPQAVPQASRVSLVGRRTDTREQVVQYLHHHRIPLVVHGFGWPNTTPLSREAFLASFRESTIHLNIDGRRRVFETTGARGFLITTPIEGLQESFLTDEASGRQRPEVVLVRNAEELLDKVRFYLQHDAIAQGIARRGQIRALREHTWFHRFQEVFGTLGWKLPSLPEGVLLSP